MRVAILGATGGTGQQLLQQALAKGHQVTAIVRRPEAITLTHPRLRVSAGDVMQPDSLTSALLGQDAVLSVVGQSSFRPITFYRQSAQSIVQQMRQAGVERLVCLTSVGVLDKPVGPWWYVWFIKPLLGHIYAGYAADGKDDSGEWVGLNDCTAVPVVRWSTKGSLPGWRGGRAGPG